LKRRQAAGTHWLAKFGQERIVVFDGGLGTALQALGAPAGGDELLVETEPELVRRVHEQFLAAGADVVETNSFGGAQHTLAERGLGERCFELNRRAAAIACRAARSYATPSEPRFVAGSVGPGSKLPSLGQITFAELLSSFRPQIDGLLAGGVDCLILETSQDLLQLKAALAAVLGAFASAARSVPVIAQVTLNEHGRTLTGSDIASVLAAIEPYPVTAIGVNCSLGPAGMAAAVRYLAGHSSKLLSAMPNAGLPRIEAGKAVYDLSPEEFSEQMKRLAEGPGLAIAGGCCGTTPEHIRQLRAALDGVAPLKPADPAPRVSSLFSAQDLKVEPRPLFVGERTNASGSKRFRERLLARDFDGMVAVAQEQKSDGAQVMDLSVAAAGGDEVADMKELAVRLNSHVDLPVMVDSTRYEAVEAALERLAGRCIVNSVNLEDPQRAGKTVGLCRRMGAALVLMTIDDQGMAMTCGRKLEVAGRLYDLAVRRGGLAPQDVFFDFLTFTLASGDESLREAGAETLKAIREARRRFPKSLTLLGISNISYGLAPGLRRALNSVFLHQAVAHGLDAAIVHAGGIAPLSSLDAETVRRCEDVIFNRRRGQGTPLEALLALGQPPSTGRRVPSSAHAPLSAQACVLAGDRAGIAAAIAELLKTTPATEVISKQLLPAMAEVGRRFESGEMQLPFVLRSAEAVRAAFDILKSHLPAGGDKGRGTLLIATVRGDVHDIGKNLVDMILSSNGFKVVNLGVRQTPEDILAAAREHRPDAIGLSGLLVESARAMREYVEVFAGAGLSTPVICGGAALNRAYVDRELRPAYPGKVYYAKDAIQGLSIMQAICGRDGSQGTDAVQQAQVATHKEVPASTSPDASAPVARNLPRISGAYARALTKLVHVEIRNYAPLLDLDALFRKRWRMLGPKADRVAWRDAEYTLDQLLATAQRRVLWHGAIVYGLFAAEVSGSELRVLHPGTGQELTRLRFAPAFARRLQRRHGTARIHVALQVVSTGAQAAAEGRRLAEQGRVHDQFLLHGLSAELTEALAEFSQRRLPKLPGWQKTARFSPGYPVWPDLSEQQKVFALLRPERIGITLSDGFQMVPEYSTSAIVLPA